MNAISNDELHARLCEALTRRLTELTVEALQQHGVFNAERCRDLAKDILFPICAALDGSGHSGVLDGELLHPCVGFYQGDEANGEVLVTTAGSSLHEFINDTVDAYFCTDGVGRT